jgi:alpha-mannosidase
MSTGRNLTISVGENTPIKAVIHIEQTLCVPARLNEQRNARSETQAVIGISTDVILHSGCDWVEFKTHIDNTARDHRLRVAFPTDIQSDHAFAGQPFDVVMRPVQPDSAGKFSIEDAEPWVGYHPMSDFCGLSDGNTGVAIAGDGIIEYEVLPPRNALCLTLLRATDRLHPGVLEKGQKFRIPGAQLLCGLDYRYAFIPFAKNYEHALPSVERFRHPLCSFQKDFLEAESMPEYQQPPTILPLLGQFIRVDSLCQTTAIKPAQDGNGIILRLYNPVDQVTDITITVDPIFMIGSARRTRMDELDSSNIDANDNLIHLQAMPKECVTIRLLLKLK